MPAPALEVSAIGLVEDATEELLAWARDVEAADGTVFEKARRLATRLGAHPRADGLTEIGFWTPELAADRIQPRNIVLEVFTALQEVDLSLGEQTVWFRRDSVSLVKQGDGHWGVIAGLQAGDRDRLGSLYWLRYLCPETNEVRWLGDCLAASYPFGLYAPAEVYDTAALQRRRADLAHFAAGAPGDDGVVRVPAPGSILQLHVSTASPNGFFSGLTRLYAELARKLEAGEALTPAEQNFIGFDAVQLLPIEPTVEFRAAGPEERSFFQLREQDRCAMDPATEGILLPPAELPIRLGRPDGQNWGYDVVIFGGAAVNPALLESRRPDELIDFVEVLHGFPGGPIQLIYDLVYGHADNQAIDLLNGRFLKGPNMYGQDVNHQNPVVRAILLEMQRRKCNTGADGIRVDGGQDFRFFNPISGRLEYDDPYLLEMAEVPQQIGTATRQLFVIYEDGRPWPAEGWEEISTYRDLVELRPDACQWGPLIFAHNTPTLEGFWDRKWRRVCEQMRLGDRWITGCGNHDTLRRGTQVDPSLPINRNLGEHLPQILSHAYDNPAVAALTHGFSPGLPMDFIHCLMRTPWGFFRNTDDRYGVKVVAEEAGGFLDWQITAPLYGRPEVFRRIKALGFSALAPLRRFLHGLAEAIETCGYDLEQVALQAAADYPGGSIDVAGLKGFAASFMEDACAACNVWLGAERVDPAQAAYNLALRRFRRAHPWLRHNLAPEESLQRISTTAHTVFHGLRRQPLPGGVPGVEAVAIVAHMGGGAIEIRPEQIFPFAGAWQVALASPGLALAVGQPAGTAFLLQDSQAVLFEPAGSAAQVAFCDQAAFSNSISREK